MRRRPSSTVNRAACANFIRVRPQQVDDTRRLLARADAHEPDDGRVRQTERDGEMAEVRVERDEHAPFRERAGEDFGIAGIALPFTGPDGVEALGAESLQRAAPHATVE